MRRRHGGHRHHRECHGGVQLMALVVHAPPPLLVTKYLGEGGFPRCRGPLWTRGALMRVVPNAVQ